MKEYIKEIDKLLLELERTKVCILKYRAECLSEGCGEGKKAKVFRALLDFRQHSIVFAKIDKPWVKKPWM